MKNWHYAKHDQQQQQQTGPVSEPELKQLIQSGALGPFDWVWNPEFGSEWRQVQQVPELADHTQPAIPGAAATQPSPTPLSAAPQGGPTAQAVPPQSTFPRGIRFENPDLMTAARSVLKGQWGTAVAAMLVYYLLTQLVTSVAAEIGWIISLLITGPLSLGLAIFFMNLTRCGTADVGVLFTGFKNFGNALGVHFFTFLFTLLWALLLIIPGIIASISYSMSYFILADNPNLPCLEAIRQSKEMMRGYKWQYFCLGFRFLGWVLLAVFFTLGIGLLWVFPYMQASYVQFYERIRGEGGMALT